MTAYEKAHAEYRIVAAKFNAVRDAYRARTVGDAEFLAARAEFDKANAAFDLAEAAELA